MNKIKFYKGESISLIFTAYDEDKKPIDISTYTKEVRAFTAFSTQIVKSVTDVAKNSFRVDITSGETASLEYADTGFSVVVKLSKGDEVRIGKSIPFVLIDPSGSGCENTSSMHVDEGLLRVDMPMPINKINIDMALGNTVTTPIIRMDELRRVIALILETDECLIPVGEDMVIDTIKTRNVSQLWIKPDDSTSDWVEVDVNTPIAVNVNGNYDLFIRVKRTLTTPHASIYMQTTTIRKTT